MPNHVTSRVTIAGPPAVLDAITERMAGPDGPFDFNRLLPMPDELRDIVTGSAMIDGTSVRRWREADGKSVAVDPAETASLLERHGAADWYDWAVANWGTKWNCYDVDPPLRTKKRLVYRFDTAWASPVPLLQKLADTFGVDIDVRVSGEIDGPPYRYVLVPPEPEQPTAEDTLNANMKKLASSLLGKQTKE